MEIKWKKKERKKRLRLHLLATVTVNGDRRRYCNSFSHCCSFL
ncbi:hypothetical protein CCACVL1_18807 [Corchorus capsularis]|uniref:Uncharacterized protein n=1 Tax=Corchorus capsularis TaxID=210143 RepID=A0A1R3HJV1_COCAP|nr:hypothetical protein CCACVL1_18807 [Corchorus capsularis]